MKKIFDCLHFSHPTAEQTDVLKAMEDFVSPENQYDFMVLCGAAGTGKTSITAALIGYLNELGMYTSPHAQPPRSREKRIFPLSNREKCARLPPSVLEMKKLAQGDVAPVALDLDKVSAVLAAIGHKTVW
jgi:ABC-type Mn2+/Zn2+ transport system ATPase subunit